MTRDIEIAALTMVANPTKSDSELADLITPLLEGRAETAWLLVELLPIAFGSVIVERAGVKRSNTFIRSLGFGGWSPETKLSSLPYWELSVAFAKHQESISIPLSDYFAIAGRSPEIDSLNKFFESGANPEGSVSGPVILMRSLPDSKLPNPSSKKSWWKLWLQEHSA